VSPTDTIVVRELARGDERRWDDFIFACPDATFFHRAGWRRVIEESFGHKTYYLTAERDGRIVGVLPLTHVTSPLFGSGLVSNAFCVYGGPAVSEPAALAALDARAKEILQSTKAGHLEYRNRRKLHEDWPSKADLYATFRRALDVDPDKNLKAIPRKQRAVVRKTLDEKALRIEIDGDPDRLYHLYATSVRNLGTPVFPRRYFRALAREFGGDCDVMTVLAGSNAIGGVMNFYFRDEVLPYYAGGTPDARKYGAHDYMYWEVMQRAVARGCRLFDFGRSKAGTGAFSFKKNWGFAPEFLPYEFQLPPGASIPDNNPLNPKYKLFIAAWKRLPLPLANAIGPHIARGLG
jgi:FemAB-related protein (PEP-CTERM system-associated)